GYVPTTVSEDVYQSILFSQLNRCMSVLHGDAGVGKTKGAIKFAKDHPNSAVYIKVSPTNSSITGVVTLLARKLGISGVRGRRQLMDAVCTRVQGTNKVIIIDEAQFLNPTAIDALRSISDGDETSENPGNGVCLIGNSRIQSKIKGSADAGYAQIFTRIHLQREYRTTQTTREDISSLFPQLAREGRDKELDFLFSVSRSIHSTRDAVYIFDLAVKAQDISFENLRRIAVHMGVGVI
ncbi:MAG: AAA family ATPase, partial [Ruthenibacterium sp.]